MYKLAYDAGCAFCSSLSDSVATVAGSQIEPVNLSDSTTEAWLNQVRPLGWKFAPYLLKVTDREVKAWTGMSAAVRLGVIIGPRRAMKLLRMIGQLTLESSKPASLQRRRFLKLSAYTAAASGAFALIGLPRLAYAQSCSYESNCVATGSSCYSCGASIGFGKGTQYSCPSEGCTTYVFSCCSCC